jgi:hypothetical protein
LNHPDITKAQIVAVVQSVIAVAAAFGLPLTSQQSTALIGLSGLIAVALTVSDSVIRNGRAHMLAASISAAPVATKKPTTSVKTPA